MEKILIIDDSTTIQRTLALTLRKAGFETIAVSNGSQGLDTLESNTHSIRLAVIDLNMPQMDGLTVLSRLRNIVSYISLPVVVLTASGDKKDCETATQLGANAFLQKPVSSSELLRTVSELIHP